MRTRPTAHLTAVAATAIAAALAGCAHSPSPSPMAPLAEAPATAPVPLSESDHGFTAAASILAGFDLAPSPAPWRIGDRVLLGIRFTNHAVVTERMLLVELAGDLASGEAMKFKASRKDRPYELESEVAATRLTLYDRDGVAIDTAKGRFPIKLLGFGLYDGARWSVGSSGPSALTDPAASLDEVERDRMMRGWLTLFSFSGSLNRKGMFREMMRAAIARPTLLAMLLNPSVSMQSPEPGPTIGDAWTVGSAATSIETINVPLTLTIAGKDGLIGSVVAARPVAPLSLCGGVLMVTARNGDDPAIHLEIRLLAAARGEGGQEFVSTKTEHNREGD